MGATLGQLRGNMGATSHCFPPLVRLPPATFIAWLPRTAHSEHSQQTLKKATWAAEARKLNETVSWGMISSVILARVHFEKSRGPAKEFKTNLLRMGPAAQLWKNEFGLQGSRRQVFTPRFFNKRNSGGQFWTHRGLGLKLRTPTNQKLKFCWGSSF